MHYRQMTNEELVEHLAAMELRMQTQMIMHIHMIARHDALKNAVRELLIDESETKLFDERCELAFKAIMQVQAEKLQETNPEMAAKLIDGMNPYDDAV